LSWEGPCIYLRRNPVSSLLSGLVRYWIRSESFGRLGRQKDSQAGEFDGLSGWEFWDIKRLPGQRESWEECVAFLSQGGDDLRSCFMNSVSLDVSFSSWLTL